jgi:hypothetical protein
MNLGSNYEIYNDVNNILFSILYSAGYITETENNDFKLPNNEIKTELQSKLYHYYEQQYKID